MAKKQSLASQAPPPIPGEPPDVLIAVTAAANAMGVPPAVAASTIAAAKSGDKGARHELQRALTVYEAARKGDPVALRQIAAVRRDTKLGDPTAAQKAAFLAAATGSKKGWSLFKRRKTPAPVPREALTTVASSPSPRRLISFGNVYRPYALALTQGRRKVV
jgi:hypothetical protein